MATPLLPPNASPLERALELAMAHYGDVEERDVPVDRLWRPRECPVQALPWLAWALGVKRWDPTWPEATRRDVVARAIETHRRRGTIGAVRRALDDVGAVYDLVERPGDAAHTMAISVLNSNDLLGTTGIGELRAYVEDAKRYSTHYTLDVSSSLGATEIFVGAAAAGVAIADIALTIDEAAA